MICPLCHQAMRQHHSDTSSNPKDKKVYNRNVYQCMGDDVWMTLEIPADHPVNSTKISENVVVD